MYKWASEGQRGDLLPEVGGNGNCCWIVSHSVSISPSTVPPDKNEMKWWRWRLLVLSLTLPHPRCSISPMKRAFFSTPSSKHKSITCSFALLNQCSHEGEWSVWAAFLLKGCIKAIVWSCWNVATVTLRIVSQTEKACDEISMKACGITVKIEAVMLKHQWLYACVQLMFFCWFFLDLHDGKYVFSADKHCRSWVASAVCGCAAGRRFFFMLGCLEERKLLREFELVWEW